MKESNGEIEHLPTKENGHHPMNGSSDEYASLSNGIGLDNVGKDIEGVDITNQVTNE
ncbi:MAG: hypothetical protein ACMG6E_08235 [Candidatus Roizmanbacteria bacterium]